MKNAVANKGIAEEERSLFRRFQQEDDARAKDELFFRYENLLAFFAHRYSSSRYPFQEVYQIAAVGLLKAMRRFDPDKEIAFSTFAYPTVDGELKRFYRDHADSIRLPRNVYELRNSLRGLDRAEPGTTERLCAGELAGLLRCTEDEMLEALNVTDGVPVISLDRCISRNDEDSGPTLGQNLGDISEELEGMETRVILEEAMVGLESRERFALEHYYFEGWTQAMIADSLGISQMQVSRIMRQATGKLKDNLAPSQA